MLEKKIFVFPYFPTNNENKLTWEILQGFIFIIIYWKTTEKQIFSP